MNEIAKSIVTIICSIIGALIAANTMFRNLKKDTQEETKCNTQLVTKIDYISKGVDDIRLDIRDSQRKINDITERVVRVEESSKSAHKRIDELEK